MYTNAESCEYTKVDRKAEIPTNCHTDDYIGENNHALLRRLAEETDLVVDMLFPPVMNLHTSQYRSTKDRWG